MRRVVKLFLLTLTISSYGFSQTSITGITAEQKLRDLLNNTYYVNSTVLPGDKIMIGLEHYKVSGETETIYAKNSYIYQSGKMVDMIFESDLGKPTPEKQKFSLNYTDNNRIESVVYKNLSDNEWISSSEVFYSVDENGFGDSVISYMYSVDDDEWKKYTYITFTKSEDGKTIEAVGNYLIDSTNFATLLKSTVHLDDFGRPVKYEYYDFSSGNGQWTHKYDYDYLYTFNNTVQVEYMKSFVNGSEFKTEYFYKPNQTIERIERSQRSGNDWLLFAKTDYIYDENSHIDYIQFSEVVNGNFVHKTKQDHVTDAFGNATSVDMYYIENGILALKERNKFFYQTVTGVEENPAENDKLFELSDNYPNPFNPNTSIAYRLSAAGHVKLVVFDVLGRQVETLVNGVKPAGNHIADFDGKNLTSGIYLYQIQVGNQIETKKMMLMK